MCEVYSVSDIKEILSISKKLVYFIIKKGYFPVLKFNSGYRIPKKSFDAWLENLDNKITECK